MVRAIRRVGLTPGLSYAQAADVLWTLASPETYDLLVADHIHRPRKAQSS
jgi:hypothetical protein